MLNAVEIQENALKFYMGMPINDKIIIPESEVKILPVVLEETAETSNRSEYRLMETQKTLLEFNRRAMKSLYYPTLSATAGYNYIHQHEMPLGTNHQKVFIGLTFLIIGLNLNIPIFTGFGTRAKCVKLTSMFAKPKLI